MFKRKKIIEIPNGDGSPPPKVQPIKRRRRVSKKHVVIEPVVIIDPITGVETIQIPAETKPEPKSVRLYFHAGTQAAIVAYQTMSDQKAREKLYVTEIMPAFEKLAENLINIHKFTSLHDSFDDLKSDCVCFLFETIRKFDASRGTNAFSYFNVVAKNWLIIKTKQRTQKMRRNVSLDDPNSLSITEHQIVEDHYLIPSQESILEKEYTNHFILKLLYEIRTKVKTENELACINSIVTIFENINEVDLLNKSAVLLYMRELSGLSPKQLTTTMQLVKKHYKKLKVDPRFKLF